MELKENIKHSEGIEDIEERKEKPKKKLLKSEPEDISTIEFRKLDDLTISLDIPEKYQRKQHNQPVNANVRDNFSPYTNLIKQRKKQMIEQKVDEIYMAIEHVLLYFNIPRYYYSLGEPVDDCACLEYRDGKWVVYELCREKEINCKSFDAAYEAGCELFDFVASDDETLSLMNEMLEFILSYIMKIRKYSMLNSSVRYPINRSTTPFPELPEGITFGYNTLISARPFFSNIYNEVRIFTTDFSVSDNKKSRILPRLKKYKRPNTSE